MTGSLTPVPHPPDVPLRPAHPPGLSLHEIAAQTAGRLHGPSPATPLSGITHDSRAVRPGDLYAALPGATVHGADFARQAAAAGALAVLTDAEGVQRCAPLDLSLVEVPSPRAVLGALSAQMYGCPADALLTFGITGTNGKTTTAHLLAAALEVTGRRSGLLGTVGTRLGSEMLPSARTTPEAPELQALLAVMVERGLDAVAMEVSSHALSLGRVDGISYDVAVFTNLSQDHLDFHDGMEDYFAAKAQLFTADRALTGVVNTGDTYGRRLAESAGIPIVSYAVDGDDGAGGAQWRACGVREWGTGSAFTVEGPGGLRQECGVPLPGAFNVANALAAVVALTVAGIPLAEAARGVAGAPSVPGRMEPVQTGAPFRALVDFAHTPDALSLMLAGLRSTGGRVLVVVGCGGDRDRGKRPRMGEAAARGADVAILTSDNPRSESPAAILEQMAAGARAVPDGERAELHLELDRRAAIELGVRLARPGDVLVVAGKGHETGQEIAGTVVPFDDRLVLRDCLAALEVAR